MARETYPPMPRARLAIGAVILALADIFSKYVTFWILGEPDITVGHGRAVIPGFFYLTTRYNKGVSWGWFSKSPAMILVFVNLLILGGVIYVFFFTRKLPVNRWMLAVGMLLMAGAVGNMYDRLFHAGVRDFLDFVIPVMRYDYPVFNLADIFIVGGVLTALVEPYLSRRFGGGGAKAENG
ncbi:MAG: signal peptidase II [Planctomycetes bacterium]|nr:signal peptidase II [Planctomycetota bacterium]